MTDICTPLGATHIDTGPGITKYLRINDYIHDYWCDIDQRWITFEGGHNAIQNQWVQIYDHNDLHH